jgi:hypothetical protein
VILRALRRADDGGLLRERVAGEAPVVHRLHEDRNLLLAELFERDERERSVRVEAAFGDDHRFVRGAHAGGAEEAPASFAGSRRFARKTSAGTFSAYGR